MTAQWSAPHVEDGPFYGPELASCLRTIRLAIPGCEGVVFRQQAREAAALVRSEIVDKHDAVDALAAAAPEGMEPEEVQAALADAFRLHIPDEPQPQGDDAQQPTSHLIAKPYIYRDPATIPRREFLYGRHYIRKHVSATVAPGAIGKSSLDLTELVAMALGVGLAGERASDAPLRGWYINGEEDQDEIDRRIAALCQHYDIDGQRLVGRLLINSMRASLAYVEKGAVILNGKALAELEQEIKANSIDVIVIDPWVCFQSIPEKDNISIDALVRRLKDIAERTNSAIEIIHHTRKLAAGQDELTTEDSRGGSSLMYAVRSGRVLNRMTTKIAAELGIDDVQRRLTFRIDNGKQNLSPPEKAKWARLIGTQIANGDNVQAVAEWKYPDAFEGVTTTLMHRVRHLVTEKSYRADAQAKNEPWIGILLAEQLNLDLSREPDKAKVKQILKKWFKGGVLDKEEKTDANSRKKHTYVIPGNWNEEPEDCE